MNEPLPATAYALPDFVPADLQILHAEIIARLRREADAVPLFNTIQELLVERIAFNYIILRFKEGASAENGRSGFAHERNQKEFNTFWLSMTQEFNRTLQKSIEARELRDHIVDRVSDAMNSVLGTLPEEEAAPLRRAFADAFTANDL